MQTKIEFAEYFKNRTKKYAVEIIQFCKLLPNTSEVRIIKNQLIKCSTSVGANYRAACRARSDKEFYSKLCIVVEEADESIFWLEILSDSKIVGNEVKNLIKEGSEILAIAAKSRKTTGQHL